MNSEFYSLKYIEEKHHIWRTVFQYMKSICLLFDGFYQFAQVSNNVFFSLFNALNMFIFVFVRQYLFIIMIHAFDIKSSVHLEEVELITDFVYNLYRSGNVIKATYSYGRC